ncbi:hypothetical protein E3E38_03000 [Thermococcus sp. 18S1]|uniref:hypothetical protein n=1 Tax=Thermococcus sp. 18S1 TaxID=1638210 RepID=UPI00143B2E74|nr:hypothetical protein [Thermococcus sp. 18S1]NJE30016.1 hypothetical protein [Thermococcus sp. 18S1]
MRRSNKKRLIPLALALALALIGTALAVPAITVSVQSIGAGGPVLVDVPGGVSQADVDWELATNPDYVAGVKVTFDQDLPTGTRIIVKVYASGDDPTNPNTAPTTVKSVTLSNSLTAGTTYTINFDTPIAIGSGIDKVAIVLVGP